MNEFNMATLLGILRKCVWYIAAVAVIFAICAYAFCSFIAVPTYQSKISFIGTNGGMADMGDIDSTTELTKIPSADIAASLVLIPTFVDIFKEADLYEQVSETVKKVGIDYTTAQIKSMVSVSARSEDSLYIDITVTTTDPKHSVIIAEAIYGLGGDFVISKMPKAYVAAMGNTGGAATQNYPNTPITIILAAFLGAVFVFAVAIVINMMDKTIKGEKDFSANYDIPILGNIPNFKTAAREEKK